MKIRIVCYDDPDHWICGKIARRLNEALSKLGYDSAVVRAPDKEADVNHHVIYLGYRTSDGGINTLMVTHVDDGLKLAKLKEALKTARVAVCQSRESVGALNSLGISMSQLQCAYIASDGNPIPRRWIIGLSTRLYPDGRKLESYLVRLLDVISPADFSFKIMGFGWTPIVEKIREKGFGVEYTIDFDYDRYLRMIASLDYFLYLGRDEGSTAFIDALAAGVKTIVQPQGFHLDAIGGITHSFVSFEGLRRIFEDIAKDRHSRLKAVEAWTWENYARKHLEIWKACLGTGIIPVTSSDGLTPRVMGRFFLLGKLWCNVFLRRGRMLLNINKDFEGGSRFWEWRLRRARRKRQKN